MGTAKMTVTVNQIPTDTVLLRVEHNWVPAERMPVGIPGLFLHDYRYWTVDGIQLDLLNANARLDYNGSTSTANGYLDNTFFSNSEDSLVLMYRPNPESEWMIADSFLVNKQGSANNKIGFVTVYGLQKGEYCFGIWDFDRIDTLQVEVPCEFTAVAALPGPIPGFSLFPNPSNDHVMLTFEKGIFAKVEVLDILGRKVIHTPIPDSASSLQVQLAGLESGTYLVMLTTHTGLSSIKKLIRM
ncbi:MAG: T9SS type A sorting domain-containing protein [Bacteroidetes bacterium]|nr:T9SS type A sorting domain-containing protein [Bacteroidota bacterium]